MSGGSFHIIPFLPDIQSSLTTAPWQEVLKKCRSNCVVQVRVDDSFMALSGWSIAVKSGTLVTSEVFLSSVASDLKVKAIGVSEC